MAPRILQFAGGTSGLFGVLCRQPRPLVSIEKETGDTLRIDRL